MTRAILYSAVVAAIEDAPNNSCNHENADDDFHNCFKVVDVKQTGRSADKASTEMPLEHVPERVPIECRNRVALSLST